MDEQKKEEKYYEQEEGQIINVDEEMKANESVKSTPVKNINQKQDVIDEEVNKISNKEEAPNVDISIPNKKEESEVTKNEEKDKNNNIITEDIIEGNQSKKDIDNNEPSIKKENDNIPIETNIPIEPIENKEVPMDKQKEDDNNKLLDNNKETEHNNINEDEEDTQKKESENNAQIKQEEINENDSHQLMEVDDKANNEENKPKEEIIKEEPIIEEEKKPEIKYQAQLSIDDFAEETRAFIGDYICNLCKGIYYNPVLTSCAHTFCKNCFDTFTSHQEENNEGKYKCPTCNSIMSSYPFPVEIITVLLNKQHIRCKNRNFGCNWEGILSQLMEHLDNICPKQTIQCTLQGCTETLFREDLANHLTTCKYRIIQCEFCLLSLPYIELQGHLDEICPKIKVDCPQKCGLFIEREKLEDHVKNECGNTVLTCPFGYFQCNTVLLKKELQRHLDEEVHNHLKLCMERIQQIDGYMQKMDSQMKQFDGQLNEKINDIKKENENIKNQIAIIPPPVLQKEYLVISKNNDDEISFIGQKRKDPQEDFIVEQNKDSLLSICPIQKKKVNDNLSISNSLNGLTFLHKSNQLLQTKNIKRNDYFDTKFISPFIELSNNRAKLHDRAKSQYSYLFSSYNINCSNNNYDNSYFIKWSVTLLSETKWIGCGLCSKNEVINNNYSFQPAIKPDGIKGAFIICSNGYGFNCYKNDSQVIINHSLTNIGDVMEFYYYPKKKELVVHFKCIDNRVFTGKMNEVYPKEGIFLTPCIVFIHSGNEIEISKFSYI